MIGIYKIENKINGKIYIGQSIDINRRLKEHKNSLRNNKHINNHLQYAFNKYGEDNFIFEIIDICEIDELDAMERLYINKYESKYNEWGYNLEDGGSKNKKLSEETRAKISKANKGENNAMHGKKHSEESKAKMSKAHKGKKISNETKKKMSKAQKGRKHTDETKAKMSKAQKGENHPLYGKHHSDETKEKMSKAHEGENNHNYFHGLPSEQELLNEYKNTKTTYAKLGEKYGCSRYTISRRIKKALKNED